MSKAGLGGRDDPGAVAVSVDLPVPDADRSAARIDLRTKFLYGVGELASSIKMVIFGLFLFFFYTAVMGLPGTLAGIGAAIGLVWDAVTDPLVGQYSDRMRSRYGRRHLLMFVGSLTIGVTFWLMFRPPQELSIPALFAWFIITTLLARFASTLFLVPYYALGAELSPDYNERTSITSIRAMCGLSGAIVAAGLSFVLFFRDADGATGPTLNYDGYPSMGLTLGMLMSAGALIATIATLRWRSQPVDEAVPAIRRRTPGSLFHGFRVAFQVPSFRVVFISFALVFLGIVINSALAVYFYTYFVEIAESAALGITVSAFFVGAIIGSIGWYRLSRDREKRTAYLVATLVTAGVMISAYFLVGPGRPFGTGNAVPLIFGQLFVGLFASAFWILPASMIADVTDEDELNTGQRREGTFFGLFNFGYQLAAGISIVVAGIAMDLFARFDPDLAEQPAQTVERIGMLFTILPAGFLIIGAMLISRYSLTRERAREIRNELATRRRSRD
jgi:glycoside/pentoside/hexuronide:cation symporter, GPH family